MSVCPLSVLPVCTVPPGPISVPENNTADVQLVQISSGSEVTLALTVNPENFFYLRGNAVMVKKGLDYEVSPDVLQTSEVSPVSLDGARVTRKNQRVI